TYTVHVKDSRNCVGNASVNVDMLWVELGDADTLALNGETVVLEAANSSTPGYSFLWQDGSGNTVGTGSALATTTAGVYTVIVSNGACSVQDTREVIFLAEIVQD